MASSGGRDYRIHIATRAPFDPRELPAPPEQERDAWYIVQFNGPLTLVERKRLRETYGLSLSEYLPNFAYFERLKPSTRGALSHDGLFRAIALYESSDKISPNVSYRPGGKTDPDRHLRVVLFDDVNVEDFLRELYDLCDADEACARLNLGRKDVSVLDDRKLGGRLQVILPPVPKEVVLALSRLPRVRWLEEKIDVDWSPSLTKSGLITNPFVRLVRKVILYLMGFVPGEPTPGGLVQSGTPWDTPVWNQGIQGQGQVIGITDFAINPEHCMFSDGTNPIGANHRKIVGTRQRAFKSAQPHGHVVAALAAGYSPEDPFLKDSKGMAWLAKLSLDDRQDVRAGLVSFLQALTNQADDLAFIHSNSWHEQQEEAYGQAAVDADTFVWDHEEHLVCGSTGNTEEQQIGPPGRAKNALCISASGNFGAHMSFGDGSAGPVAGQDLRWKPDVCAPGCHMTTAGKKQCKGADITNCATSWATPIAAGTAALVRQYYLEGWYPTGAKVEADRMEHPSAALVKATLLNSTVDMTGAAGYPSNLEGWGRMLLTNTLFFADEGAPKLSVIDVPNATGLHVGESHTYNVTIRDDSRPLKITLVWSDPPNHENAARPLVNNLDLIVTSPDGKTFLGNQLGPDGISFEGGTPDDINNVEMVIRNQNLQGVWTVTISCAVTNGTAETQGYALVLTGAIG